MANNSDIISLVSSRQYKSISNIEILSKHSVMRSDYGYDYKLNLQTKDRLSSTFDIYVSKEELEQNFIEPIKELIRRRKQPILDPIITTLKNQINYSIFNFYSLNSMLRDSTRRKLSTSLFTKLLTMKFTIQDKLFIFIESESSYRYFLYKHKPKSIQPERIILSLDDAEYLISTFECLHKS